MEKNKLVLIAVQDFPVSSKISEIARNLGIEVFFMKNTAEAFRDFKNKPQMLIIDLNLKNFNPLAFVEQIRLDKRTSHLRIVGYHAPQQLSLKDKAEKLGCNLVLPRNVFETKISSI